VVELGFEGFAVVDDKDGGRVVEGADEFALVLVVGGGVVGADELETELEQNGFFVAVGFDRDKGGAFGEAGADRPAGEFGGEGGFAFAALADDEVPMALGFGGVVGAGEEAALEGEEFAAAANETGGRRLGEATELGGSDAGEFLLAARVGPGAEQDRVGLGLEQNRDEPVLEFEVASAEDAAAVGVEVELALTVKHGIANPFAVGEGGVEVRDEALGGFDQNAVAHGDDRGDAGLKESRGHGAGGIGFGLGGLAGFKEDERQVEVGEGGTDFVGVDELGSAFFGFGEVVGIFKAEGAEAFDGGVDAVAIEVQNVVRLGAVTGGVEFGDEGGEGGLAQ